MYSIFATQVVEADPSTSRRTRESGLAARQRRRALFDRGQFGKFLDVRDEKFWVRGVTYGTFRPREVSCEYPRPDVVEQDFAQIATAGLNTIRTYPVPPRWLLDAAQRQGLRVMVGVPWEEHITFLDDRKRATSLRVIPKLKEAGAVLRVYDPQGGDNLARMHAPDDQLRYVESAYEASRGAHALLILTGWSEFRELDLDRIRPLMQAPIIVDGRNLFDPVDMRAQGFEYSSLGRGDAFLVPGAKADHNEDPTAQCVRSIR